MTRASKRKKRGQDQKNSKPKRVRPRSNETAHSTMTGTDSWVPPPILRNMRDNIVIHQLRTSAVGELAVDALVTAPQKVPTLRAALREVYFNAAKARQLSKATKSQLKNAKSALSLLMKADKKLEKVSIDGRSRFRMLLEGSPLDDTKGEREGNEFDSACSTINSDVVRALIALHSTIQAEERKPTNAGERRKRLRTLVDALADAWQSAGGKLAPTVVANRRDDGPAVVHGRDGDFLTFAIALFCEVDVFKKSEVEAAVTNVHEKRSATTKLGTRN